MVTWEQLSDCARASTLEFRHFARRGPSSWMCHPADLHFMNQPSNFFFFKRGIELGFTKVWATYRSRCKCKDLETRIGLDLELAIHHYSP